MLNRYKFFLILLLVSWASLQSQNSIIINSTERESLSLNGTWNIIIDPFDNGFYDYRLMPFDLSENPGGGAYFTDTKPKDKSDRIEYDFNLGETLVVPGDWNSQQEKLLYYEGALWYRRIFDYKREDAGNRIFIWFGGANYRSDVYLNGKKLGTHIGGFTPFNFELTDILKEKDNSLVVRVDNKRAAEAIPTLNFDWWNYGGITRDVRLLEVPSTFITDYVVQLNPEDPDKIRGFIQLNGEALNKQKIQLHIPGLKTDQTLITDASGKATFNLKVKKVNRWSPENPHLYDVYLKTKDESILDKIGFRTIQTKGSDILLNGEKVFLRGISIHAENPYRSGRATCREDAALLLGWAQELGCNFVRLAHYPHSEYMVKLADEMGIMVWEENPVYWTIHWNNPDTYKNAENQLTELINRDKNRASVIIWSMANETPLSPERLTFLSNLADKTKSMDKTRLISAALEKHYVGTDQTVLTIDDPFADKIDVLSFNQYLGWYDGLPDKCRKVSWDIKQNKPVVISEFGGGALQGFHGDSLTRWSEEFQAYLYRENINMLKTIPQLSGMTPWILVDFRSPRRALPVIQDGWNRKGLISSNGQRKQAFYILQKYYKSGVYKNQ